MVVNVIKTPNQDCFDIKLKSTKPNNIEMGIINSRPSFDLYFSF